MNPYTIKLRDADEIEEFYHNTTGMKPGFLQLSAGAIGLQHTVVELGGVTLIWTQAQGRTRWRDDLVEGALKQSYLPAV